MAVEAQDLQVTDEVVAPVPVYVVNAENRATVTLADLRPSTLRALVPRTLVQNDFVRVVKIVAD